MKARSADGYAAPYEMALIVVLAVVILFVVFAIASNQQETKRKEERLKSLFDEAQAFAAGVIAAKRLPEISSRMLLKKGEKAYFECAAELFETRAVRHYQSGYAGMRIAKGVYIGQSRGTSMSTDEWQKITSGRLCVSNKRLVFDGAKTSRVIPFDQVVNVTPSPEGVEISIEGRQKSVIFKMENGLKLSFIIRLCIQATDLSDLNIGTEPAETGAAVAHPTPSQPARSTSNVVEINLLTNNPDKEKQLANFGLTICARLPIEVPSNSANAGYLATKKRRMGHQLILS